MFSYRMKIVLFFSFTRLQFQNNYLAHQLHNSLFIGYTKTFMVTREVKRNICMAHYYFREVLLALHLSFYLSLVHFSLKMFPGFYFQS